MIKLFVALALVACSAHALRLENCYSSSPVQLSVSKFPDPLYLRKGNKIVLTAKAVVRNALPDKLRVSVKVQKKMLFWITLPCVSKIGSCTYDVSCAMLKSKIKYNGKCPLDTGTHELKDFAITLPHINVPSFLTNGRYYLKADIRDGYTNKQVACASLYITIRS